MEWARRSSLTASTASDGPVWIHHNEQKRQGPPRRLRLGIDLAKHVPPERTRARRTIAQARSWRLLGGIGWAFPEPGVPLPHQLMHRLVHPLPMAGLLTAFVLLARKALLEPRWQPGVTRDAVLVAADAAATLLLAHSLTLCASGNRTITSSISAVRSRSEFWA